MNKRRIVITGIGVLSPIGIGQEEFTNALRDGKSGANLVDTFDTTDFNCKIAANVKNFLPENFMDKKKARRMARFTQLGVAAAKMAIEDSGLDFSKEDLSRIGCITGTGIGGMDVIEEEHTALMTRGPRRVSPFLIPMIITNMLPGE
ncbi:MAG: beta-ketoacyl synthase N-terminal-like domain-containing protein, partial [Endomicrobiia bacterium]